MSTKSILTWVVAGFAGVAAFTPVGCALADRVEAHGRSHERIEVVVPGLEEDIETNRLLLRDIRETVRRIEGRLENADD